jgi:hypothetical protein
MQGYMDMSATADGLPLCNVVNALELRSVDRGPNFGAVFRILIQTRGNEYATPEMLLILLIISDLVQIWPSEPFVTKSSCLLGFCFFNVSARFSS